MAPGWLPCRGPAVTLAARTRRTPTTHDHAPFRQCGVPRWRVLETTRGIVGTPLLEINTKFYRPATYGDALQVQTCVEEWRPKVFIQHHRVMRGEDLLCEGRETRAFVVRQEGRLKAIPVPEDIKAMCV
jgi:4-hydroxybenzoyl-CoA thioesterase